MKKDTPAEHLAMFKFGDQVDILNASITKDLDREIISQTHLRFNHPAVVAQVMMQNMADPMHDCDTFTTEERLFWTEVAFEMGPDWIAKFRRIGAFMAAVDKA